jgi:hypothetical protein
MYTGCAAKINLNDKIQHKSGKMPLKNIVNSVYTGDIMYQQFDYTAIVGARFKKSFSQDFMLATLNINRSNNLYPVDKGNSVIYCSNEKLIDQIGSSDFVCLRDNNNDNFFDEFSNRFAIYWTAIDNNLDAGYEITDIAIKSGFKRVLLYNGFSNNTINLEYREFIDNIARPAFYQNLKYEFNGKPIQVRYKNIIIKIFNVNNNEIKYSILE